MVLLPTLFAEFVGLLIFATAFWTEHYSSNYLGGIELIQLDSNVATGKYADKIPNTVISKPKL